MPQTAAGTLDGDIKPLCKRCSEADAAIIVRHEHLCNRCFIRYVESKIVKRMEGFRVRNSEPANPRKLLLPVSFGVSSLVVLHVLNQHLQRQVDRTGRQGYSLHILHITYENHESASSKLQDLERKYPRNVYYPPEDIPSNRLELLTSLETSSSRMDMYNILRARTIVAKAKSLGCEAVIWGHSTTRLAESIMAETAKGRGQSVPWLTNDGQSPAGTQSIHPCQDLLRKELFSYWQVLASFKENLFLPVDEAKSNISSRNTSIDQLMNTYFSSVEENYPSIVANVLRTSGKLSRPDIDHTSTTCAICDTPLPKEATGALHAFGVDPSDVETKGNGTICYGCARSTSDFSLYRKY